MKFREQITAILRADRIRKGLSQQAYYAPISKASRQYGSDIENGRANISAPSLETLAEHHGLQLEVRLMNREATGITDSSGKMIHVWDVVVYKEEGYPRAGYVAKDSRQGWEDGYVIHDMDDAMSEADEEGSPIMQGDDLRVIGRIDEE